ncbi:hypothetical protein DIE15_12345 [Burkholderia sp. Bp9031]|nr:hypothetical protein DIE15_12345 [Burkholderia sp. Bp9031]
MASFVGGQTKSQLNVFDKSELRSNGMEHERDIAGDGADRHTLGFDDDDFFAHRSLLSWKGLT